jgi:hypothetical protein
MYATETPGGERVGRRLDTAGWHRPMLGFAALMVVAVLGCGVGLIVDHRVLLGSPIWLKPLKFALSMALYCVVWSWMYGLLARGRRLASAAANIVLLAMVAEYVVIVGQVLRGRQSHFNVATPLDATLWAVMAFSIAVLWIATLVLTVQVLRAPISDLADRWAVRLGASISLVGLALGGLMTGPTPAQLQGIGSGVAAKVIGAHTVGLPDGGPGMPLTGWSTVGGDLRIPHFIGMHALQLLPLLAIVLRVLARRLPGLARVEARAGLVIVGAGGYAGLVALVTWQAERGQSLIHPDGATLVAAAVLAGAVAVAAVAVLLRRPRAAESADAAPAEVTA